MPGLTRLDLWDIAERASTHEELARTARRLPAWALRLGRLARAVEGAEVQRRLRFLNSRRPSPFEELLAPVVVWGRSGLWRGAASGGPVSRAARAAIERSLLRSLTLASHKVLDRESRGRRGAAIGEAGKRPAQAITGDALISMLRTYPVLARLLSEWTESWRANWSRFLDDLKRDSVSIQGVFGFPPDRVAAIEPDLSDPHDGARSAALITFDSGLRIVYKPRSVAPEAFFFKLLSWLNGRDEACRLSTLRVLDRGSRGWMEFVPHQAARPSPEFFRRCGRLLCLLYLLGIRDVHFENVVSAGPELIPVDLEMLFDSPLKDVRKQAGGDRSTAVLHTGFLPYYRSAPAGGRWNACGLFAGLDPETRAGTDWQTLHRLGRPVKETGQVCGEPDIQEILTGFTQMFRLMMRCRRPLSTTDGPLQAGRALNVRFLARPTQEYVDLLRKGLDPQRLKAAVDRSACWEGLPAPPGAAGLQLQQAEKAALQAGDIPRFTVRADSTSLELPGCRIENVFARSGFELALERLRQLDEARLEELVNLIRTSLRLARLKTAWP